MCTMKFIRVDTHFSKRSIRLAISQLEHAGYLVVYYRLSSYFEHALWNEFQSEQIFNTPILNWEMQAKLDQILEVVLTYSQLHKRIKSHLKLFPL